MKGQEKKNERYICYGNFRRKRGRTESIFKAIMVDNFQTWDDEWIQIHEAIDHRLDSNVFTLRHCN